MDLVLTIPAASSDAERGFNRLKFAKNDWRSKLSDTNLSDQLTVMLESADISNFDPLPAVSLWNMKLRRPRETVKTVVEPQIIDVDEEQQEQEVVNVEANVNEVVQQGSTEDPDGYVSDDDYTDENENDDDVELKATYNDRMALANKMYKQFCELFQ